MARARAGATKPRDVAEQANGTHSGGETDNSVQTMAKHSIQLHQRNFDPVVPKSLAELEMFAKTILAARGEDPNAAQSLAETILQLQFGMEIGLLPGEAAANLYITRGKVAMSAEFIRSRVFASGLVKQWQYDFDSKTGTATLKAQRTDNGSRHELRLHLKDFNHLIAHKDSAWATYPKRMILARITTYMVRDLFPDVLRGVMSFEEASEVDRKTHESKTKHMGKAFNEEIMMTDAEAELMLNKEPSEPETESDQT